MNGKELLYAAKEVLEEESRAINHIAEILDDNFIKAIDILTTCKGKVVVTGMGKSGHIAHKIAATLASTGTPAVYLNPAEGVHGDLGVLTSNDRIIAISKSGETTEVLNIIPHTKRLGIKSISITNTKQSPLARDCDISLVIDVEKEACPMNLAPTTSTTATLALGDALAVALMKQRGFTQEDFAILHPGGTIGKNLRRVESVMDKDYLPIVSPETPLYDVMETFTRNKNRGVAIVVNGDKQLAGIIVDGDLKRILLKDKNPWKKPVSLFMTSDPKVIFPNSFIEEALKIMENRITCLVVIDNNKKPIGILHIHDILNAKII